MKILWVKTDFLHPTTRGGQIRTLEMLRQLHKRHEIHYVAFNNPSSPEGLERSKEYAHRAYPVAHHVVPKTSPFFALDLVRGLISKLPVAGFRYRSQDMQRTIDRLLQEHDFDACVCDFLFPSVNISSLDRWTVFQHNVESVIWDRHAISGKTGLHRAYFGLQAKKMEAWERSVCRQAANVIAVSETDAEMMQSRFGLSKIASVPTGVDVDYFRPVEQQSPRFDLVFVGSMDWMPNVDGMQWFLQSILPHIRQSLPDCRVCIVGRNPPAALSEAARQQSAHVTGTVPDVRPFLWQSLASIVPLRVGGGTRLKIFEAMAAGIPVVSTKIGAEGLPAKDGKEILIRDSPEAFADACVQLVKDSAQRQKLSERAFTLVSETFSWESVTLQFEQALHLPAPVPVA